MAEIDDQSLFEALAVGGSRAETALRKLYDHYARRLLGLLRGKGFTLEEAEEIVQETFLKLYQAGEKLRDVSAPKAYLYRTAINCSADLLRRKQKSSAEIGVEPAALASAADDTVGAASQRYDGFMDCFESAYDQFESEAPDRALAIRLAVIEGMDGRELAEAIGRSYGAAREFLSQTRKRFQAMLESLCGDYVSEGASL